MEENKFDNKAMVNWKRYTKDGEQKVKEIKRDEDETIKENLIIKGNNLPALHSLKKQFAGKVKLIYIDPPYNTGNDGFKYNDNFNHSTWLTFMRNRLEVARELLRDDGVIFVQCDDNEQAYLKVLMDEVFGKDNFINTIALKVSPPNGIKLTHADITILKEKEYIHVYAKNKSGVKLFPQYKPADKWDAHYNKFIDNRNEKLENWKVRPLKDKLDEINLKPDLKNKDFENWIVKNSDRIFQKVAQPKIKNKDKYNKDKIVPIEEMEGYSAYQGRQVQFLKNSIKDVGNKKTLARLACDLWDDIAFNNLFQEGNVKLKSGKKPEKLIYRIINLTTKKEDLVMDFFLGSGTTCAVAHKMDRQYIGIEQMDYIETIAVERMKNVIEGEQGGISKSVNWQGGGDFIYFELAKWNKTEMADPNFTIL